MSGETRQAVSGWTTDTLKAHTDAQFTALDLRLSKAIHHAEETALTAHRASQLAIDKAETATTDKFESVNEFRKTLADQSDRMMPRVECDARFQAVSDKMDVAVLKSSERLELVIARMDKIETRLNLREGAEAGNKDGKLERREETKINISMVVMIVGIVGVLFGAVAGFVFSVWRSAGP